MRRTLVSILATVGALVAAAPASAGTLTTPELAASGATTRSGATWTSTWPASRTPNPAAPGSGVTLTQTSVHVAAPGLPRRGTGTGSDPQGGRQRDPRQGVGRARRRRHAAGRQSSMQLETVARTTDHRGRRTATYVSSTPIDVTVPIPDTAWTVGTAALGFRQAGAGTLPPIPAGPAGRWSTPLGSAFIRDRTLGGAGDDSSTASPAPGEGASAPAPFDRRRVRDRRRSTRARRRSPRRRPCPRSRCARRR